MKKLQNNFTTPEQSKRLLELGVPRESADCFYPLTLLGNVLGETPTIITFELDTDEIEWDKVNAIPCWSAGRLIEIMKICNHPDDVDEVFCELAYSKKNLVELIVRLMEENKVITDFSKLEE